ncbi:hypothetical protein GCM10010389_45240 [Streptomyces echinoruber]|uniref:Resolvase/invertase-type recombinase catalytic domain-containing protein n=2 Tax=Streptomyces echinoruber TaxID=68898 RepID=A0A918VH55_9ACTN|nr:hypothetical protein GCM10010389_45240 [Streptomyces echinoruber]
MTSLIPQRPALYCRLSYAPDGSLEKVERQEEDGRAMGARLKWPDFCCVYVDNSRSAWQRNRKRPDWDRMLITLDSDSSRLIPSDPKANHHHDGIMTYHGDRLIRQPYDLELLLNIADTRRIPLASVSGVRDLSNPDDRFILRIEAAQACRESDNTSRRVRVGVRSRMTGKGGKTLARSRPGGRRPFGWGVPTGKMRTKVDRRTGEEIEVPVLDFDKTVPEETELLAEVAERILAGLSKRGAVRWMNQRSRTSMGNLWTETTLTRALTAWRMAGLVEYEGVLYKAAWDEVIPLEMLEDLRTLFAEKASAHGYHGRARKYLLSGHAICSTCHDPKAGPTVPAVCSIPLRLCKYPHVRLSTKPIGKSRLYYCRLCGKGRNQAYLDAYVVGRTLRLLADPRLVSEMRAAETDGQSDVRRKIAALEQRKAALKQQIENAADDPDIDPILAMKSVASYDRKLTELRAQLSASRRHRRLDRMIGITREAWEAEHVDVRAATIQTLWHVAILPAKQGPGFDPASVKMWRRTLASE